MRGLLLPTSDSSGYNPASFVAALYLSPRLAWVGERASAAVRLGRVNSDRRDRGLRNQGDIGSGSCPLVRHFTKGHFGSARA